MRLDEISITDYRNLARVQMRLHAGVHVLVGGNAQGKSNLLEALYMLATMRAIRAETDAQVVRREALDDVLPAARVVGSVHTVDGPLKLEVTVVIRPGANGPIASKTVKVNGVGRRLSDAVGRLTAVLFTADDLATITGAPSLRRRYLDMTLSQADPAYAAARSRFERVLSQRNSLLKRIREGLARNDELPFWDEEIARDGAVIVNRRRSAIESLAIQAASAHANLAPGEQLTVGYKSNLPLPGDLDDETLQDVYHRALVAGSARDIAAGMTLSGPHRDDVSFTLDGFEASGFASRAQQRTIALSLRLAEVRFLAGRRDDPPVLLLDDILSEMDVQRRESVMGAIAEADQVIVTGTEAETFPGEFLRRASLFLVERGSVVAGGAPAGEGISGS